jgi:hypothetical protein
MKNEYSLINLMYRKSQALFWGGLVFLILLTLVNHIDVVSPMFNDKAEVKYTVRGHVGLFQKDRKTLSKNDVIIQDSESGAKPIVLLKNSTFVRLDYTDLSKGFSIRNSLITLLDVGSWWVWLILIYQLMKILGSIRANKVFNMENIKRIRIIGLVFLISPLLLRTKAILFTQAVADSIEISGFTIFPEIGFWVFPKIVSLNVIFGFMVMLFVFLLAQIFAYGLKLKAENDLTV